LLKKSLSPLVDSLGNWGYPTLFKGFADPEPPQKNPLPIDIIDSPSDGISRKIRAQASSANQGETYPNINH